MEHKRVTLFAGHYGSGKTNIAVNYALRLAREGKKVVIADLDIVNPYFRSRERRAMLEQAGFTEIKTYGDQSFAPVQGGEDRIYFTARKRD